MQNIYETTVLKDKQYDFLIFLRDLGITKEDIKLSHSRGDYNIYELDLSNKDKNIRSILNAHQVDFL